MTDQDETTNRFHVANVEYGGAPDTARMGGLKTVAELNLVPVWVNPDHLVSTCRLLLSGHQVKAIAVMDGQTVVGMVAFEQLAGADENRRAREVMKPVGETVQATSTIRSVASTMTAEGADFLPVFSDGKFIGVVTAAALLKEMSRTWDPLTGLSWSDRLREWGVETLKEAADVTIIFIDLDDFGAYNKRFGHIVGDRVLQKVSKYLGESIDDRTDVLVRYGGDEFAIGTTRTRMDAERLVQLIEHRIDGIFIGDSERPVSVSIGIFGGRRTNERENMHLAATLDTLINLASRECMAAKEAKKSGAAQPEAIQAPEVVSKPVPKPTPEPAKVVDPVQLKVVEITSDRPEPPSVTMVSLQSESGIARGVHARTGDVTAVESVARATLSAIERAQPDSRYQFVSASVSEMAGLPQSVEVSATNIEGSVLTGSGGVHGDVLLATAEAALNAVQGAK